jgi:hypothetical protein
LHVENDGQHMFCFQILTHFSAVCNVFLCDLVDTR